MNRSSTVFLQILIVLLGIVVLSFMLWEPHIEGRNANATPIEIYFQDPFLAYAYVASISFFVALYQAFRVLGYAAQNKVFSQPAVNALRTIKHCAMAVIGFVALGLVFILMSHEDDKAGGIAMGISVIFGSIVVTSAAAMFEKILQKAVDLKSENDLTV